MRTDNSSSSNSSSRSKWIKLKSVLISDGIPSFV